MSRKRQRSSGRKSPARGPIARKVIAAARAQLQQKVVSITDYKAGQEMAAELRKTVVSEERLADYDPLHAAYIFGQNQLSVLIEHLVELPMVAKLAQAYAAEEEEHSPFCPPMSPLTTSYFTCWGSFDLCSGGLKKESLATIAIDVSSAMHVDERLIALYESMQASRMGIYLHEGVTGRFLHLRELITGRRVKAICASGYSGRAGELWYVRLMPPLDDFADCDYSVVFTTPYVLGKGPNPGRFIDAPESDWLEYFDRNLGKVVAESEVEAYETLMKYGMDRAYWNEYVFLAYRNHQHDMIYLDGVPDIISSLPHGKLARTG